jgi:tRNA A-37 threonylcarbamoyl transferase component Bud32
MARAAGRWGDRRLSDLLDSTFDDPALESALLAERFAASQEVTLGSFAFVLLLSLAFLPYAADSSARARLISCALLGVVSIATRCRLSPAHHPDQAAAHEAFSFISVAMTAMCLGVGRCLHATPSMPQLLIAFMHLIAVAMARNQHFRFRYRATLHVTLLLVDLEGSRAVTALALGVGELVGLLLERETRATWLANHGRAARLARLEAAAAAADSDSPLMLKTPMSPPTTTAASGNDDLRGVVLREIVGRGGYATVWRACWMDSTVAVKCFSRKDVANRAAQVRAEVELLRGLRHPRVCTFFGTCTLPDGMFGLVLEYLHGGSLREFLGLADHNDDRTLADAPSAAWAAVSSSTLLQLCRDVASGLHFLHAHGIVHRDVKTANCLLDAHDPPRAKLTDFGISTSELACAPPAANAAAAAAKAAAKAAPARLSSSFGTPRYMPPEITRAMMEAPTADSLPHLAATIVGALADVYSYSLCAFEILHGRVAFGHLPHHIPMLRAAEGLRPALALRAEHAPLAAVIEACWDSDPQRRPSMARVIEALESVATTDAPPRRHGPPALPRRDRRTSAQATRPCIVA